MREIARGRSGYRCLGGTAPSRSGAAVSRAGAGAFGCGADTRELRVLAEEWTAELLAEMVEGVKGAFGIDGG